MTREEAIDVFKHNYPSACFTELCEAVEIAIQALSAQPEIIRCGECKHRDKRYLCDVWNEYIYNGEYYCGSGERIEE